MITSFDFLKNFDPKGDKLKVIYFQSIGATEISEGEINPITESPLEEGYFLLLKNLILKISINKKPFYVWFLEADDPNYEQYDDFFFIISRDKDFKERECFPYTELKFSSKFQPKSETPETFPFVLKFLNFFVEIMVYDYEENNFSEGFREESEIQFLIENPSIDTGTDFSKHKFNWNVSFNNTLIDLIETHHNS